MASLIRETSGVQLVVRLIKNGLFAATGPEPRTPAIYGDKYLKRLLWYLLGGTRGGPTRAEILKTLRERPLNANQLAEALRVDYKTIQHHLRVLEENGLTAPSEKGAYGAMIFLTPKMEEAVPFLEEIWSKIGRTKIRTPDKEDR
jgi:DNA-binding transcriptional ArsR family regulator